jgi:peptidoglycan/xylan/chitin deacetylase (PgdA/CDA1 family)
MPRNRLTRFRFAGTEVPLAFGVDTISGRPDWLGELFLWLSGGYERDISKRDSVGRIPTSEMIFQREGFSPRQPYASVLMAWMENVQRNGDCREELPRAMSPVPGVRHLVLATHDIDFYFVNRASTLLRLIKNLGIAAQAYRSWSYLFGNLRMIQQLFAGKRIGDFIPALLDAAERDGFRSSFFAVTRGSHRRDAQYRLEDIIRQLALAAERSFSVGIHGSYHSAMENPSLRKETELLRARLERRVLGNRQHWLRFAQHKDLFHEIRQADLLADSTLGFPDTVGFRNGASFAFPPYDFENERPHSFLEIPLILMDGGLEAASRAQKDAPQNVAEQVLRESRKYGWGGVAILWHNPIEPLAVPSAINDVFWRCAAQRQRFQEEWISLDQFLACCLPRYQQAGLLKGIRLDG